MQSITFAHPTLTTAQMTRQDQIDVSANQSTAAIVCCYLEHMNAAIAAGIPGATAAAGTTGAQNTSSVAFLSQPELVSLINDVQTALRTIN